MNRTAPHTHRRTGRPRRAVLFAVPAVLAVLSLVAAGCAGKVKPERLAADFDPLAHAGERYAVAGFVAAPDADRDGIPADAGADEAGAAFLTQSDAWGDLLYGAFVAGATHPVTWAWAPVRENVPAGGLAGLHAAFANGEPVTPAMLATLAGDLPEIRYAVLARVDRNDVSTSDPDQPGLIPTEGVETADNTPAPASLHNTSRIRRTVGVTLAVFDLKGGRAVWQGTVERGKTELISAETVRERQDLVVKPAEDGDGLPELEMRGASLEAPALDPLLAEACRALVANLFAPAE